MTAFTSANSSLGSRFEYKPYGLSEVDIHAFYIPFLTVRARWVWARGGNDTVFEVAANSE